MASLPIDVLSEVTRVLEIESQALQDCAARLKAGGAPAASLAKGVEHLRAALESGGKIVVTGVGKSGKIAQKIAATLCSTGSLAVFLHPTEGLHGDLGLLAPNDAVLALSYTGNTDELVRLLPSIRSLRVPVIGVGGNAASQLAEKCDVWIDASVAVEACPHNLAPTSSTTLALALGDAIAVALMQLRGFDARAFARNHPGGALGRRLHLTVEDVMHSGDSVPVVGPEAPVDQVISLATQKALGAVLVAEGTKLIGLITEGDIRRALSHRERFFTLMARDIMTRSPISVLPADMAQAALDKMENRPKPINVLPVVAEDGSWRGLVRVHDLIRSL